MEPARQRFDDTPSAKPQRWAPVAPPPVLADLDWANDGRVCQASPPAALIEFATAVLRRAGLRLDGAPSVIRHEAGDRGLPARAETAPYGFAIDLSGSRHALEGGLLLFADSGERVFGWRAEAGALTTWSGAAPDITELAPGVQPRLTLLGGATPL